jgi:hypothetical protein
MKSILAILKVKYHIGTHRKYMVITCDGNPYMFMQRIVNEDEANYNWLVVVPGKFHVTYNMLKCLNGHYFEFGTQEFARHCSHLSKLQKESIINFKDYHRAKDVHLIQYFYSKASEIVRRFVSETGSNNLESFLNWSDGLGEQSASFAIHYEEIFR